MAINGEKYINENENPPSAIGGQAKSSRKKTDPEINAVPETSSEQDSR